MSDSGTQSSRIPRWSPDGGVYLVLMLQSLIASGTHVVAKSVVRDVDPFTLTTIRSLIASIVIASVLIVGRRMPAIRWEDYGRFFWLALIAIPINQFLFLYAMRYTTASNAALLYATTPAIVLVLSRVFLGERITARKVVGVALAFTGVIVVMFGRGVSASMEYVYGNVIMFVAVLSWGFYTVFGRPLIVRYGAVETSSVTLLLGACIFAPIGIPPALRFAYGALTTADWMQILYLGIVTSVFSYWLWYYALSCIEAGKAALFANLQPVLTAILAVSLLGQDLTVAFLVGGTITIAGVAVAQFG